MPFLEVRDLRKSYGDLEVVRGVNLSLETGECHGLLAPNGAGKTTTLLCLGLAYPDAGEISLLGLPAPRAAREARIRLGVLPQLDNLNPDFTVFENLLVYGRSYDFFLYYFTLLITPMVLVCGVFSSTDRLGGALQAVSAVLPLTHAVQLARPLVVGVAPAKAAFHVLGLVGYAAVAFYIALVLTRRRLLF